MKYIILALLLVGNYNCSFAQAPSIQWQKCYGGANNEEARSMLSTWDNGYIVAGYNASNGGDVTTHHGTTIYLDSWIVKLNDTGRIQWQKSLGGSLSDGANCIQHTSDSGYIIAGYSSSVDGDVTGLHGLKDFWIVKINDTGAILWEKCLGGSADDVANSIRQTSDGGYIIAGYSMSNDMDASGNHGYEDYWIVKINDTGAIQWQKSYGGSARDMATSVLQTFDGGYIVSGFSLSSDGDVTGSHGSDEAWVLKINDTGAIQWKKSLGSSGPDGARVVLQTSDSGFFIGGSNQRNDGDVTGNHGYDDCWVVKLNNAGTLMWQRSLGGSQGDYLQSAQQTIDGGFIIAAESSSNDGDVAAHYGSTSSLDYWIVKLNDTGSIQWQKTLGGTSWDQPRQVQQTNDGGYIVAGLSQSLNYDVTGCHGSDDYWIVKLNCGLHAGTITGPSTVCTGSSITLTDTASGGVWSASNTHATVLGGLVTGVSNGIDTIYYTVTNTCGTVATSFAVHVTCPAEAMQISSGTISVVPNPTSGIISVTGADKSTIKVYNTIGQLVAATDHTNSISIAQHPAGLYFVRVFNEKGELLKQEKIIKK